MERMSGALQENVLTLLCYDREAALLIRSTVEPSLFESSVYQEIASAAISFVDLYREPVGDHLPDVLSGILDKGDRKANLFKRAIESIHAVHDRVNRDYVLSSLNKFVHEQTLKKAILAAVEHIEGGRPEEADKVIEDARKSQIKTFDKGLVFGEARSLGFLDTVDVGIPIGIAELDKRGINLQRKEVFLFIAPPKKGKSWCVVHVAKNAMRHRLNVCVVTLEMSEERYAQRFVQSIFAISKRDARLKVPIIETDDLGRFVRVSSEEIERKTLMDSDIRSHLQGRMERMEQQSQLVIKQFPTGALTVRGLEAYLDSLERLHKFVPDVLVVDYPDLMKTSADNLRVELGNVFKDIRGLCVSRNMAGFMPTQGGRIASKAKLVDDSMVTEDYSKIMTADMVVTYSQTAQERSLGLARLFVSNGRNEEDKFVVLIAQSYPIGQFCLDSVLMTSDYWDRISSSRAREDDDDD